MTQFKQGRYKCMYCGNRGHGIAFNVYARCQKCSSHLINPMPDLEIVKATVIKLSNTSNKKG